MFEIDKKIVWEYEGAEGAITPRKGIFRGEKIEGGRTFIVADEFDRGELRKTVFSLDAVAFIAEADGRGASEEEAKLFEY